MNVLDTKNGIITKSDFTTGMVCEKLLWYKKIRPDLFPHLDTRLAEEGNLVGELARGLFPGVVTVTGSSMEEKVRKTKELVNAGTPAIAEAAFLWKGLYCQIDILLKKDFTYEIYEVKAVTSIRSKKGKVEDRFLYDVGFQQYVITKEGIKVGRVCIVHLNGEYRRTGDLDIHKLFVTDDMTFESTLWAINRNQVKENVERFHNYLKTNDKEPDARAMNTNCASISDPCPMRERCMEQLGCCDVWNLNGSFVKPQTKLKLFREGIVSFSDLAISGRIKSEECRRHIEVELTGEDIIRKDAIQEFVKTTWSPLAYLDFETYQLAIPEYDDQRPYEKMPFQYSIDIKMEPGGNLIHKEFLGDETRDPRRELAEQLIQDIPRGSCVIVYNKAFEKGRLKELSKLFPDLAAELDEINDNVVDIMIPFKRADYYTKDMKRSYSIKKVLPALYPKDPSLDYSKLPGVKNGQEAMNRFLELRDMDEEERKIEREGMLKYCGLDTFAMVMVHRALEEAVS